MTFSRVPIIAARIALASALFMSAFFGQALAQTTEDADYLSALFDFPLMPGLSEEEEAPVIFDKPGGRIIVASFSGKALPAEVVEYYLAALNALGWQIISQEDDQLGFRRDEESLMLSIGSEDGRTRVRLILQPSS